MFYTSYTPSPTCGAWEGTPSLTSPPPPKLPSAPHLSQVDYPAACNAVEKILVHESLAGDKLQGLLDALRAAGARPPPAPPPLPPHPPPPATRC